MIEVLIIGLDKGIIDRFFGVIIKVFNTVDKGFIDRFFGILIGVYLLLISVYIFVFGQF
jgi:hypothetical protein